MKRRTVIAALGTTVAFAGCLADDPQLVDDAERLDDDGDGDDPKANDRNDGDSDEDSVVEHFDGEPARPECETDAETVEVEYGDETREYETAETIPYPDPPTEFAREEIVEYVEAFENAYVTHDVLCSRRGSVLGVYYSVQESETFDWYDDITIVFLLRNGGAVSGIDGDGNVWEADLPVEGVVFAVDESGVARADVDDVHEMERDQFESRTPDPLDSGTLVAVFE